MEHQSVSPLYIIVAMVGQVSHCIGAVQQTLWTLSSSILHRAMPARFDLNLCLFVLVVLATRSNSLVMPARCI